MDRRREIKTIYHITRKECLPSILKQGLQPRLDACAFESGEDQMAVHVYASPESVRDALAPSSRYRQLEQKHFGEDVELCVLQLSAKPYYTIGLCGKEQDAIRILHPLSAKSAIVLDLNLHPISSVELENILANRSAG